MKWLIPLLLFSSAALAQTAPAAPPMITVTGEAVAKLPPDQVKLPVTAEAEAKTAEDAKAQSDKKLKVALALAKEVGATDIRTQYNQLTPVYDMPPNGKRTLRGYQAVSAIEVTLDDTAKLAPLMEKLVEQGIDQLGAAQFGLKDEKKVRDSLLAKAAQDARAKAQALADALGMKAGKPLLVSENGGGGFMPVRPMAMRMGLAKAEAAPPPDLPGGEIEIRQQVNVNFALE